MLHKKQKDLKKKWIIKEELDPSIGELSLKIANELAIDPVIAKLLVNRGCTDSMSARAFIKMETELLGDPMLLADISPAIERIRMAVEGDERIVIYGDYDVDGVTAVSTLYLYLKSKGADIYYYIPNRAGEGYGVSGPAISALSEDGATLIITVDTGITAVEEVEFAKSIGVDFVITDHHECRGDLPRAVAVVNPHRPDCPYPFKELAGVGVVFKVICAYECVTTGDDMLTCVGRICRGYADLISIGTIADVMPVKGENKLIISYGLRMIEKEPRVGISALIDSASTRSDTNSKRSRIPQKITSGYIGFTLAPRINAAGRIRSASCAVELFLTDDYDHARSIADELCETNRERQRTENEIIEQAYAKIEEEHDFENDPVIILADDSWHHGVIGIVASRITEKYGLPSILVSFEGCDPDNHLDSDVGKGSGRSVKGMNLVDALVRCSEHLVKYGGHELAAGLSVTRGELEQFKKKINEYARTELSEDDIVATLEADCVLDISDINMSLAEDLRMLEPYGSGNVVPTFVLRGCTIFECTPVSAGKHTRFVLGDRNHSYTAMFFSRSQSSLNLFVGDAVDIIFNLDINEYAGRRSVQLIIKDMHLTKSKCLSDADEKAEFERIWAGENFLAEDDILPVREDFVAVYNLIRRSVRSGTDVLSHRAIVSKLAQAGIARIGYCKLKVMIRVFQELNIIGIEEIENEVYRFKLNFSNSKSDLEKSNLLRRLRAQQK